MFFLCTRFGFVTELAVCRERWENKGLLFFLRVTKKRKAKENSLPVLILSMELADDLAIERHIRSTAFIYSILGAVIISASLLLLLVLYFTSGTLFWYFFFSLSVGAIFLFYGLVHVMRLRQFRRIAAARAPGDLPLRAPPAAVMAVHVREESKEPAPTAPPPDFVQAPHVGTVDAEKEVEDFSFEPVAYEKKTQM